MPITIKQNIFKYKNPTTGQYQGVDVVAETATSTQVSAIQSAGTTVLNSIPPDYTTMVSKVGTADLTTSAQNVCGAINEHEGDISALNGAITSDEAMLAPVLTQLKADTALVAGDLRVYNHELYKITDSIASGANITVGSGGNAVKVNLSTMTRKNSASSGTDSYTYYAFQDGILIQSGSVVQNKGFTETWQGMYLLRSDEITFPLPFTFAPFLTAVISDGNAGFLLAANKTYEKITQLQFVRPTSTTAGNIRFDWYAVGRWK